MSDDRGFFVMDVEVIKTLQDELGALLGADVTRGVLFRCGFRSGRRCSKNIGLTAQGRQALGCLGETWAEMGLGMPLSIEENGSAIIVRVAGTPESSSGGSGCDFTRGLLGGIMTGITGMSHHCVEKECASSGAGECVFVVSEDGEQG